MECFPPVCQAMKPGNSFASVSVPTLSSADQGKSGLINAYDTNWSSQG